jgi:hypothetical protein
MMSSLFAQESTGDQLQKRFQDLYLKHDRGIREALPPHSSMPPVLDLTGRTLQDGLCDGGQHIKWENRFTGVEGVQPIADLGVSNLSEATSTSLTTIDGVGQTYALPAKQSSTIVIARPLSDRVCISHDRRFVYTRFRLQVSQAFKHNEHNSQRDEFIEAVQFGGSVLFPSGHLTSFLLADRGYLGLGQDYILFLWKPISSDETLVVAQAYRILDGMVFPVSTSASNAFHYTKVSLKDFETKVRTAIAKNIDSD